MKKTIACACVYILRKLKVSTIIGFEIHGGSLKCKQNYGMVYDCDFTSADYFVSDGRKFDIPPGKYSVTLPPKE